MSLREIGKIVHKLDATIHQKTRLGVALLLYKRGKVDFRYLRKMLDISEGALASHIKKLEISDYIRVSKRFIGRKTQTEYELTEKGKQAIEEYLKIMTRLIKLIVNNKF